MESNDQTSENELSSRKTALDEALKILDEMGITKAALGLCNEHSTKNDSRLPARSTGYESLRESLQYIEKREAENGPLSRQHRLRIIAQTIKWAEKPTREDRLHTNGDVAQGAVNPHGNHNESLDSDGLVDELLMRLGDHNKTYAEIVRLRFLENWTVEKVAAELGISESTVKRRYARAMGVLGMWANAE